MGTKMPFLARFKVLTKIISVVALLAAISCGLAWLGIASLSSLNASTDKMERAATQSLMAQRLSTNLLAVNRAEFELSTDPRPENVKKLRDAVEKESKQFQERLQWFKDNTTSAESKATVATIDAGWANYKTELAQTFRAADNVKNFTMAEEMDKLR